MNILTIIPFIPLIIILIAIVVILTGIKLGLIDSDKVSKLLTKLIIAFAVFYFITIIWVIIIS